MSLPSAFLVRSLLRFALGLATLGLGAFLGLLALLALLWLLGLGVGLGVLLLELLEGGRLGLGPLAGLLLAALLLGFRLGVGLPGTALLRERHPESVEEREGLLVRLGGGGDRHVEATDLVDRVVIDLGKDDLLADPHRVVAPPVEGARVEAAEVADPRDRDRGEAVEEPPRARASQRRRHADRRALADLARGRRLLRAAHAGTLARDRRELLRRGLEHLRVLLRLADPH